MADLLKQAQRLAQLKKTKVIKDAYKISADETQITFVVEAGAKLTMTGEELSKEIATLEKALEREQAILALDPEPQPKPVKEQKPKPVKE